MTIRHTDWINQPLRTASMSPVLQGVASDDRCHAERVTDAANNSDRGLAALTLMHEDRNGCDAQAQFVRYEQRLDRVGQISLRKHWNKPVCRFSAECPETARRIADRCAHSGRDGPGETAQDRAPRPAHVEAALESSPDHEIGASL